MPVRRYSRLAIASVLLHLPWMALLGMCFWALRSGPVAGEIFLLPFVAWCCTGTVAGICGFVAFVSIRVNHETLQGLWIAVLGMLLAAVVPLLGAAENIYGQMRQAEINRR